MPSPRSYLLAAIVTPILLLWGADLIADATLSPTHLAYEVLIGLALSVPCLVAGGLYWTWHASGSAPQATDTKLPRAFMLAAPYLVMVAAILLDLVAFTRAPLALPTFMMLSLPVGAASIPVAYGFGHLVARVRATKRTAAV